MKGWATHEVECRGQEGLIAIACFLHSSYATSEHAQLARTHLTIATVHADMVTTACDDCLYAICALKSYVQQELNEAEGYAMAWPVLPPCVDL